MKKFLFIILLLFTCQCMAGVEEVYVRKILYNDDKAIIERRNGESYIIEKGIGCLSFWRYENKTVMISSPGLFLGIGSRLILPASHQSCRIWNSEQIDNYRSSPMRQTHTYSCFPETWITEIKDSGSIIKLGDGTLWEVS